MKKRVYNIFGLFTVLMVMTLMGCSSSKEEPKVKTGQSPYSVSYESVTIHNYNGNEKEVIIPSTINGAKVKRIGASAFSGNEQIEYIKIPHGVEYIETSAFENMPRLQTVELPDTITYIGDRAFSFNPNLTKVSVKHISTTVIDDVTFRQEMPSNLEYLGYGVFLGSDQLTRLEIPRKLKDIGKLTNFPQAPYMRENLIDIDVHPANPYYSSRDGVLFSNDGKTLIRYPQGKTYTSYTIPSTVETIAPQAFAGNSHLNEITIPDGVKVIGDRAFSSVPLSTVALPKSVMDISINAFSNSVHYEISSENPNYQSEDGIMFNKAMTSLIKYPQKKILTTYTVPDTVTEIEDNAFKSCNLEEIIIPDGVEQIGKGAFSNCTSLKYVTIPGTIKRIEDETFSNNFALEMVLISEGVEEIGEHAFNGAGTGKLSIIEIPSSVRTIESEAFKNVASQIKVHEDNLYYETVDCVLYNEDQTILIHYSDHKQSTSYTVPNSVIKIFAIFNNPYLTELTISESVEFIQGFDITPDTIYIESTTPPKVKEGLNKYSEELLIYVPEGTYETYVDKYSYWVEYREFFREPDGDHYDFED
ncbi:leucine-rich repeat domain-containing protein [Haloplasma contractile]|uniref:Cell surface protein Leucine-rich repeat protein n=1 Tax=Haloplasma contractile SSD-17B TaxID=1033810 RepID=F7PWG0_9MOLU|nr:leucine-rich repeat domain-containing protein [Haloplasma contractile]ERJ11880.1 putative cell surface protein Leucine-rich repeat protein [Haloplasma contractile SSD-17B]